MALLGRFPRGPYTGNYVRVTVLDGEITRAEIYFETEEFSPQMWEPFADWVSTTYPKDAAVMYVSGLSQESHTDKANALWEEHTKEYTNEVATSG